MADTAAQGSEGPELSPDPIFKQMKDRFKAYQSVVALTGYLAEGPDANTVRFYLDLDLQSYYDIPKTEIAHREPIEPPADSGATRLYVNAAAKIRVVRHEESNVEASYLRGNIIESHHVLMKCIDQPHIEGCTRAPVITRIFHPILTPSKAPCVTPSPPPPPTPSPRAT